MAEEISALGLDIGRRRIGVAGCDRTGLIATGLTTIYRQSFAQVADTLGKLVQERQVKVLVVGLPLSLDGSEGAQARQVRRLAEGLSKALEIPVVYVDERFTSLEAEDLIRQQGDPPSTIRG